MPADGTTFSCKKCGRSFAWKPQLAGKRVKCKCGEPIEVPDAAIEPEIDPDALYDIADAAEAAARNAPSQHRVIEDSAPVSRESSSRASTARSAAAVVGYQRGPSQREIDRFSKSALMDMNRDVYVPTALLLSGIILYVSYYAFRYQLGGGGVLAVMVGLGIMTAFKAALLVGFAFVIAGPLGVSFGGLWTAALKLAAIAVFSDGLTTWIDAGVSRVSGGVGGSGMFGYGMFSFPIALGLYWGLLIYLFSMDAGDSWLVVIILSLFDRIVKLALSMILLKVILGWGGVASSAIVVPTLAVGAPPPAASEIVGAVEELKESNQLVEAREMLDRGWQAAARGTVDALYAAGCKNVWFSVDRDINGKTEPISLIAELPTNKSARDRCYVAIKEFYTKNKFEFDDEDVTDDDEPYVFIQIR